MRREYRREGGGEAADIAADGPFVGVVKLDDGNAAYARALPFRRPVRGLAVPLAPK
jgi:hypothetical protein